MPVGGLLDRVFRKAQRGDELTNLFQCQGGPERIVEQVNASGDAYLTHTRLAGRVCIRVGLGNVLTTEHHLAHVWARVRQVALTEA